MKNEVIDCEVVDESKNIVDVVDIDNVKTEKQSTSDSTKKPKTGKKTIDQSVKEPDVLLSVMFRKTCGIDGIRYSTHSTATILKSKLDKISPDCYIVINAIK